MTIRHLYSTDDGKSKENRDGTLALNINGQERALSWATDDSGDVLNKAEKLKNQVLFLGEHGGVLGLSVKMIEVDIHDAAAVKAGVTKTQTALQGAAAAANFIPGVGTIVSAGLSVVSKIVAIFRGRRDDDLELAYDGSAPAPGAEPGGPNPFGRYTLKRLAKSNGHPDVEVAFRLHPFTPLPEGDRRDVVIILNSLEVETTIEKPKKLSLVGDISFGSGSSSAKFGFDVRLRNKPARAHEVLGIDGKEVYYGKWNVGVPFHINLALVPRKDGLEEIKGLIEETSKQAQRFTSKQAVKTHISNATAAIQSLRSLLTEFLPKKKTIGAKSGLITDPRTLGDGLTDAIAVANGENSHGTIYHAEPDVNGKTVVIKMKTATGGKANIGLLIQRVALSIDTDSLPDAVVDKPYRAQLSAASAVDPLTWTVDSGLPAGLSLDSLGRITGTPSVAGTSSFVVTVTDSSTPPLISDPRTFELTVRST